MVSDGARQVCSAKKNIQDGTDDAIVTASWAALFASELSFVHPPNWQRTLGFVGLGRGVGDGDDFRLCGRVPAEKPAAVSGMIDLDCAT